MDSLAAGKSRAMERLDELKDPRAARSRRDAGALKKQDKMAKMLEKATPLAFQRMDLSNLMPAISAGSASRSTSGAGRPASCTVAAA